MKYALFLFLLFSSVICTADEKETDAPTALDKKELEAPPRIWMADAPDRQEMQKLMDRVSDYCNSGDFTQFMSCFTKKKAASIRKTMKALFTKHNNVTMNIVLVETFFTEDDVAKFNLEYVWDSDTVLQKSIIRSIITAKKEGDSWKIDVEEVKNVRHVLKREDPQMNFGDAGQVALSNDDFLPRDIAKRPGGCADGKCNLR